jgi:hypothetical protein
MRRMMVLLSVAVLAVIAGVGLSVTAPPARAATPTQLTNLRFSWMGGLLQKAQVKYVAVSVTLVDPDGIPSTGVDMIGPLNCPCVVLYNTSDPWPYRSRSIRAVTLHLTSGTRTNGVWSGRFAVGAADYGLWRPVNMAAGDIHGQNQYDEETVTSVPAPWNTVTVNVRGYNWPRAWLGTPVASGSRFVVRGGVSLTRSLMPVAGLRLEIRPLCGEENQSLTGAPNGAYWRTAVRTSSAGRYAYTLSAAQAREVNSTCAAAVAYPTDTPDSMVVRSNIRSHG